MSIRKYYKLTSPSYSRNINTFASRKKEASTHNSQHMYHLWPEFLHAQ